MSQQDPYAHERATPQVPQCGRSAVSIQFNGKLLVLRGTRQQFSWSAVSGKPDNRGNFDYSGARQTQPNIGPIPAGDYWINPADLWERPWYGFGMADSWGDFRITLRVMPGTKTHGRGGFFIHGGTTAGSAGCIDLTRSMNDFIAKLKAQLGETNDCYVPVTVRY